MLRLYAPSLVLLLWALAWAGGVTGNGVIVLGLTLTAAAVIVHTIELIRRHHEDRR